MTRKKQGKNIVTGPVDPTTSRERANIPEAGKSDQEIQNLEFTKEQREMIISAGVDFLVEKSQRNNCVNDYLM